MIFATVQSIGGLILLVFAGDFLVRGAVSISERLGVPVLVIGLTVVAFGTSAPELVVAVDAILRDAPTLALGNIVGSNIANSLLVLGFPAILVPMTCSAPRLNKNLYFMLAATALFIGVAFTGSFRTLDGIIFLILLSVFLLYSTIRAQEHPEEAASLIDMDEIPEKPDPAWLATIFTIGGLIGLAVGADLLVEGSVTIARHVGVSEAVIGLTLVALGTSLPELVTAVAASLRGQCDVALGNVIGSNIFNLLAIMGVASSIGTISVPDQFLRIDLWVMLAASVALVPFAIRRSSVGRSAGIILVIAYCSYIYWLAAFSPRVQHMIEIGM